MSVFQETTLDLTSKEVNATEKPTLEEINAALMVLIRAHSTEALMHLFDEGYFGFGLSFSIDAECQVVKDYLKSVGEVAPSHEGAKGALLSAMCMTKEGQGFMGEMYADRSKIVLASGVNRIFSDASLHQQIIQRGIALKNG